jgi:uncharacterized protein YndB with AHSA1/START domain
LSDYLFAPGCALVLYREELVSRLHEYLRFLYGDVDLLLTCCRHTPRAAIGRTVINVCPGCDRRYRENYDSPSTVSLWEVLAKQDDFDFPDYGGRSMTVLDACPTRDQARVHNAIRRLAERMNISVVEPERTRERSTCCGDTFYGQLPTEQVLRQMRAKASSMPLDDVIVYCVSCSKSMFNGGRRPRYMIDLLFNEETTRGTSDPDAWHEELDRFIAEHDDSQADAFPCCQPSERSVGASGRKGKQTERQARGRGERLNMKSDLLARASVRIDAPIAVVWDALVNPDVIKQYMFGADVTSDWREMSPIVWRGEWQGRSYEDKGVILRLEPKRLLQYSHFSPLSGLPDEPENYHTVTIELSEEGSRTRVSLAQDNNATEEARRHSEGNWAAMLEGLKQLLEQHQ